MLERRTPLKRTAMKNRGEPLTRTAMKPRPRQKGIGKMVRGEVEAPVEFTDKVKAVIRARSSGTCEFPSCSEPGALFHHRERRPHGKGTVDNGLHLCNACHVWIHANVADALEAGLLLRSAS